MNASTLEPGTGQEPSCPPHAAESSAHLDGVVFLRRQQASLLRRLRDANDGTDSAQPPVSAAHCKWLAVIAAAGEANGADAAQRVARLYEYHGRVAGSLERQRQIPLPPPAAQELRRRLASRLAGLTADAVAAISPIR